MEPFGNGSSKPRQRQVGKMLAAVLLAIAEMEQETRRERQAAGIRASKERGVCIGRQPGFRKAKPNRATQLRDKCLTVPEIAQAMGVLIRTVFRYLDQADEAATAKSTPSAVVLRVTTMWSENPKLDLLRNARAAFTPENLFLASPNRSLLERRDRYGHPPTGSSPQAFTESNPRPRSESACACRRSRMGHARPDRTHDQRLPAQVQ